MNDRDYVLGTHDEEMERLGLQHSVWRAKALDGWRRAGIRPGMTVLDVGAGPGFAATDLAEIVGAEGRVIALERSARFLEALRARASALGLTNIEGRLQDVCDVSIEGRSTQHGAAGSSPSRPIRPVSSPTSRPPFGRAEWRSSTNMPTTEAGGRCQRIHSSSASAASSCAAGATQEASRISR